MAIVNATLMAELATEFNLGADILGKGNRTIEKYLGADKMSGDTVNVTIMDTGKIYDTLDITALKNTLKVRRGSVPVKVKPIGTAAEVSVEELTLAIKNPQIMAKRVANLVDEVNKRAFRALVSASQPFVATAGLTGPARDAAYREAAFDAEAHTTGSKFSGSTFGIIHPQTWNRMVPSLMGNYGANQKIGDDLFKNELGDFLGFRWTKGMELTRITGVAQGFGTITVASDGSATATGSVQGSYDGELSQPVVLSDASGRAIECVDALGKPTGVQKAVYFLWNATNSEWKLAQPLFFEGPRKNAHNYAYTPVVVTPDVHPEMTYDTAVANNNSVNDVSVTCADMLVAGKNYLSPAVMWKEPDFLIAVKGIEKMNGADSFTIPTEFSERGIMPWRGTCWTDPYASLTLFRVDAMMGFGTYQGVSVASVYLPID